MKRCISLLLITSVFCCIDAAQCDPYKVLVVHWRAGNQRYPIMGLDNNSTVKELKEQLEKKSGLPVALQKIVVRNEETKHDYALMDQGILSDYNLFDDNLFIYVIPRLKCSS